MLDLYNNGLNVPDDVTLIWVNDNFGSVSYTHLNAWAESKFTEDGKNGPGVNYYRRVFELVLRLKANTCLLYTSRCV